MNGHGSGADADEERGRTRRRVIKRLARLAVGLAILGYLFSIAPVDQVSAVVRRANVAWIGAACVLALLVQWPASRRLKILDDVHDLGLSLPQIYAINLATRFYGLLLPGGSFAAIAVRIFRLVQVRRRIVGAIAAVTVDRVVATLTMCLVGMVFWMAAWPAPQWPWLVLLTAAFLALFLPLLVLLLWQPSFVARLVGMAPGVLSKPYEAVRLAVSEIRAMSAADRRRVLMFSAVAHIFGIAEMIAVAQAVDLEVGAIAIGWVRSVMLLAALLPISVSGLGVREGAALLVLSGYGIQGDEAVAFSLLCFAVGSLFVGLIGGAIEGWRWLSARHH